MDWKLEKLAGATPRPGPLLVVVMDGVGLGPGDAGDAVALARTPVLDWLMAHCPWVSLQAHGNAVGLPSDTDMGNSEVGHNALGAGRIFSQGAKLVNEAIADGTIFEGEVWRRLMARCAGAGQDAGGALHLIGLVSDGNVHSHQDHLHALIRRAHQEGVRRLFVHALLDGRDVGKFTAQDYLEPLEALLAELGAGEGRTYRIASGGGRMTTTMDRYNADWGIVERGWNAHVHGRGRSFASAMEALATYREELPETGDQDLPEFVITEGGQPVGTIEDGDSVIFFNFRGDRAIEISRAFEQEALSHFDRGRRPEVFYAGLMQYDGDFRIPRHYLVDPPHLTRTLGEYLARNGVRQFACSETQKYGHVTYFWNGNRGGKFDEQLEEYLEIRSDPPPFDARPWMKAAEITSATIERVRAGSFRCGRINYANGDMVGHTGVRRAAILGVEAVDLCLGRLLQTIREVEGAALITADHGNSDEMYRREKSGGFLRNEETGEIEPRVSHTLNRVPLILFDPLGLAASGRPPARPPAQSALTWPARSPRGSRSWRLQEPDTGGGIANVAATCLNLLGYAAPDDYEPSLLA
ncbi:MAG: 2,3-bisphosphoglycerate-independent phosphoglycerate mutase [Candidatus Eisenbacteria bacterium]|nr:2,3-bisphosphoglycerate-independent phosphoglycerate mutase [Candidatus Eisenbacteria bacterium]